MTPEELENLSPEERDALKEDQDQELEHALEETDSEPQPEVEQDADADRDAPVEEVEQRDGNADGDDAPKEDAAPADEAQPPAKESPVRDTSPLNLQASKSVEDLDAQLAALQAKLDDGTLQMNDFLGQRDALMAERWKATLYEDMNQQFRRQAWEQSQRAFYQQHPEIAGNPILAQAYTGVLQGLLETPEGQSLGDAEVLALAKTKFLESTQALFGATPKDAVPTPKDAVQQLKKEQQGKKTVVPTLAGVPAAEAPDVGKDPFSHLDALDGAALEAALAKLPPEQVEKYLMV